MMFRVEDDPVRARRVLDEWVSPTLGGHPRRSVTGCSSVLRKSVRSGSSYAKAGVHRMFLWPVGEPIEQLELFGERVAPLLDLRRP